MAQRAFAMTTLLVTLVVPARLCPSPARGGPGGPAHWAVHVSLAPTWFDPAETPGMITPYSGPPPYRSRRAR